MPMYAIHFTVTGRGAFPLDMLRRDTCHPAKSEDVTNLETDYGETTRLRQINMVTLSENKRWQPNEERWLSFGWRVTNVKVLK